MNSAAVSGTSVSPFAACAYKNLSISVLDGKKRKKETHLHILQHPRISSLRDQLPAQDAILGEVHVRGGEVAVHNFSVSTPFWRGENEERMKQEDETHASCPAKCSPLK
jgi:hypothetical protein